MKTDGGDRWKGLKGGIYARGTSSEHLLWYQSQNWNLAEACSWVSALSADVAISLYPLFK